MSNASNVSRADLVAQYNSMAVPLGHKVVKDFKSKAIAEQRIAAIKPDFEAYIQTLEARNAAATDALETPAATEQQVTPPSLAKPNTVVGYVKSLLGFPNKEADTAPEPVETVDIVLHNNDNTAQWHVAEILQKALGVAGPFEDYDSEAYKLMFKAHKEGKAVCGTFPSANAEAVMKLIEAEKELLSKSGQYRSEYVKELKFTIEPSPAKVVSQ